MSKPGNILIVGATSGIGGAIVEQAVSLGHVYLTGRNEKKLQALKATFPEQTTTFCCDVTSETDIEKTSSACPQLDGLVYCSGIAPSLPAKYIRADDIRAAMAVNFDGAVLIVASLLKLKKINSGASIVFISSEAVRFPFFGSAVYSSSKAALETFALSLANELQPKKIRVNCIAPTYVETPMLDQAQRILSDDFIERLKKMHPEAFSLSSNIASLAAFLLSPLSASINGQILKAGRFNINIPGL